MIKIPYDQVIAQIREKSGLSDDEINARVQAKLDQLSGLISKEGASYIIANELGVNLFQSLAGKLKIEKLVPGIKNSEVLVKVQNIFDIKEFNTNGREGKVGAMIVGDETGTSRLVFWNDQTDFISNIKQDDILKITNSFIKDNNGNVELHINDQTKLEINPEGEIVEITNSTKFQSLSSRKKINELKEEEFVEIIGTIVQVFDINFFEICPVCSKRLKYLNEDFSCSEHGNQDPNYSYVFNLVLDDGTETIRVALFKDQLQSILEKNHEEIILYKENPCLQEIKDHLLGRIIKITGKVKKNTMFDRLDFLARTIDLNPDPVKELELLNSTNQN